MEYSISHLRKVHLYITPPPPLRCGVLTRRPPRLPSRVRSYCRRELSMATKLTPSPSASPSPLHLFFCLSVRVYNYVIVHLPGYMMTLRLATGSHVMSSNRPQGYDWARFGLLYIIIPHSNLDDLNKRRRAEGTESSTRSRGKMFKSLYAICTDIAL